MDAGDRARGQLRDARVDVAPLLQSEYVRGLQEGHIGADAARIDRRVEQKHMPLLRRQRPQPWMVIGGTGGRDVSPAAFHQQRKIALALGGVLVLMLTG